MNDFRIFKGILDMFAPKFENVEIMKKIKALQEVAEIIKKCQKQASGKDKSRCYITNCGKLIKSAEILVGTDLFTCEMFELNIEEYMRAFDEIQEMIEGALKGLQNLVNEGLCIFIGNVF